MPARPTLGAVRAENSERAHRSPPFLACDLLDDGRLVEVLPDYPLPTSTVRALVVDTRAARQFLDFAGEAVPLALGTLTDR